MLRKLFSLTILLTLLTGCAPASSSAQPDPSSMQDSSSSTVPINSSTSTGFTLTSTDATDGGQLPIEYTCDGDGSTLPLTWSGAPNGTQSYAVIMHHVAAPEEIHWYWVLYNIPVDVTSLPKNVTGIGTLGNNINNGLVEYSPPCSQGPGDK